MFKLSKSESYTWPVVVEVPQSGGKFGKETFDAEFKRLSQSDLKGMIEREGATDSDFCREIMIGWKGITDGSGAEVPFSLSARDELLDVPTVARAIAEAYLSSVSGAKRKN